MLEPKPTEPTSATPGPPEMHKASLAVQLSHFMQAPENPELEQRFATMLLDAQFEALVAVGHAGQVQADNVQQHMKFSVGITTYLADGQKYIPVFTDPKVCHSFMQGAAPSLKMRTFSFTTSELMAEVQRRDLAGLLINPGKQSFPLTLTYWDYINQVYPSLQPDADTTISLLNADPMRRATPVIRAAKHTRGIERLWLALAQEPGDTAPALVVIAAYTGSPERFQHRVAPQLARASKAILGLDQDVLVGTTADDLGAQVAKTCAPVFTAGHLFGRRSATYD
jgi:hypothetical protein